MYNLATDSGLNSQRLSTDMQFPLTLGFYVLGDDHDLPGIYEYCDAEALEVQGAWRSVRVPAARTAILLKILDCVPSVENIHGLTAQGRVPLRNYLKSQGIGL